MRRIDIIMEVEALQSNRREDSMTTMLNCIVRVAPLSRKIICNYKERTDAFVNAFQDRMANLSEINIIGAGSSNTAAISAFQFMEKVTKVSVHTYIPNQFDKKTVYDPNALYLFVSQTGTSTLVREMIEKMNAKGFFTLSVTEKETTPIAKAAKAHVDMGCEEEEFWYRTIGYCTSVVTLQMIAVRIALERNTISEEEAVKIVKDGLKAVDNHPNVVSAALDFYRRNEEKLLTADSFILYGQGPLYGVALEGALKILETAKHFLAIGYEAEDGLHGPVLGFRKEDCVISLNDGVEEWMSVGVTDFAKKELSQGYIFGKNPQDENDLGFEVASKDFTALEYAPAVEVLAYCLAEGIGNHVEDAEHAKEHVSSKYFETHRG